MLAKLVVHAEDRSSAIRLAIRALEETVILGCTTNASFLARILEHPEFQAGRVETGFIPAHADSLEPASLADAERRLLLAAAALSNRDFLERANAVPEPFASMGGWRN
mgnify:CR=1 FL=1